jgi:hypothetical protein
MLKHQVLCKKFADWQTLSDVYEQNREIQNFLYVTAP